MKVRIIRLMWWAPARAAALHRGMRAVTAEPRRAALPWPRPEIPPCSSMPRRNIVRSFLEPTQLTACSLKLLKPETRSDFIALRRRACSAVRCGVRGPAVRVAQTAPAAASGGLWTAFRTPSLTSNFRPAGAVSLPRRGAPAWLGVVGVGGRGPGPGAHPPRGPPRARGLAVPEHEIAAVLACLRLAVHLGSAHHRSPIHLGLCVRLCQRQPEAAKGHVAGRRPRGGSR